MYIATLTSHSFIDREKETIWNSWSTKMSDLPLISVFKTFLRTHNLKQNTMYKKSFCAWDKNRTWRKSLTLKPYMLRQKIMKWTKDDMFQCKKEKEIFFKKSSWFGHMKIIDIGACNTCMYQDNFSSRIPLITPIFT